MTIFPSFTTNRNDASFPAAPAAAGWTRRDWLARHAALFVAARVWPQGRLRAMRSALRQVDPAQTTRVAAHAARLDPTTFETLAREAVEAARSAGAQYADARLTRTVQHHYLFNQGPAAYVRDLEVVGVGVRVLVDGYWGFAASPTCETNEIARLIREAVTQAKANAKGPARRVELGTVPIVNGRWATPVTIDPFTISIAEKADFMEAWWQEAHRTGLDILGEFSYLHFARQERTVATSEGSCVSQTLYESGGSIQVGPPDNMLPVEGIDVCGRGWELFLEAKIPEQLTAMPSRFAARQAAGTRPATVGRYTVVCDGKLMGRLVAQTFGIATQLDRALGYEANAEGTSFLTDPLSMLGNLQVATPHVTITANRSAPTQLATVKWDDEGVVPEACTLVKNGVLHDFQTTREQAAWLASYYAKAGLPVRSHGYASSEDALNLPLQQMPNLALEPGRSTLRLEDLIANVKDGILVLDAPDPFGTSWGTRVDQQAKNGYFSGEMRQIRNGRLGPWLTNGAILFNTQDLWKRVTALGGPGTAGVYASTALFDGSNLYRKWFKLGGVKGQPPQLTSYSARGVAATITDQALIDPRRKA